MIRRRGKRGRIWRAEAPEAYEAWPQLTNDAQNLHFVPVGRAALRHGRALQRIVLLQAASAFDVIFANGLANGGSRSCQILGLDVIVCRVAIEFAYTVALCQYGFMAKTVIVKLTDDIDGGDADETVYFSLDGKSYEIDVNSQNASRVRAAFEPFIAKGRASGSSAARARSARPNGASSEKTLFSQLSSDEKTRFRTWANMATARRISDSRVNSWVAAGKP